MRGLFAILILALLPAVPFPAAGGQDDVRLDALFARLKETPNASEGRAIERIIWGIWIGSGVEAIDGGMGQGLRAMAKGDFPGAIDAFTTVIERAPDFAEAWNKRATVYYMMGDHGRSMLDIERTLALEPRHFGALSGLGLVFLDLGEDAAALKASERALAINPHMATVRERVRRLRSRIGDNEI